MTKKKDSCSEIGKNSGDSGQQNSSSCPNEDAALSHRTSVGSNNLQLEEEETRGGLAEKQEEEKIKQESRVGAFSAQMPRLRGLHKNRDDALESLGGCGGKKKSHSTATNDTAHRSSQQDREHHHQNLPPQQRINQSPNNHPSHQQQDSAMDQQQQQRHDIMDIVQKRAIMANEEETSLNHQETEQMRMPMPMPLRQPPLVATFDDGYNDHNGDQSPCPSHDSSAVAAAAAAGAFADAPGEELHRRDNLRFSLVGIGSVQDDEENNPNLINGYDGIIQTTPSLAVVGENNNNNSSTSTPLSPSSARNNCVLTEALPVEDRDQPDTEAQPYDVEAAKQKKIKKDQQQRKYYLLTPHSLNVGCGSI